MRSTSRSAISFLIAISLAWLESGPRWASARTPLASPQVGGIAISPLVVDSTTDPDTRARLEAGYQSGVGRVRTSTPFEHVDASRCSTLACISGKLAPTQASTVVRASVRQKDRDFLISIEARDRSGVVVVKTDDVCEICGLDDAVEMLASASARVVEQVRESSEPSTLHLASDPSGAGVELRGKVLGHTPISIELGAGEHTLTLEKRGYGRTRHTVVLQAGLETSSTVQLFASRDRGSTRMQGGVLLGLGLATLATGAALIALEGMEATRQCAPEDRDGMNHCPHVFRTKWWGMGATLVGAGLSGAGVVLLLPRTGRASLRATWTPSGVQLRGAF